MMLQPGVICPAVCFYDAGGYTLTIEYKDMIRYVDKNLKFNGDE